MYISAEEPCCEEEEDCAEDDPFDDHTLLQPLFSIERKGSERRGSTYIGIPKTIVVITLYLPVVVFDAVAL
jgi:hypothetical protein